MKNNLADALIKCGRPEEATILLREALTHIQEAIVTASNIGTGPFDGHRRILAVCETTYGEALIALNHFDEAAKAIAHAADLFPKDPDLQTTAARLLCTCILHFPGNTALSSAGQVDLRKEYSRSAVASLRQVIAVTEEPSVDSLMSGDVFQSLHHLAEFKQLASALEHFQRGRKHCEVDPVKAKNELRLAIRIYNNIPSAYVWRGKLASKQGAHGEALEYLKKAVELEPRNAFAQNALAGFLISCPDESLRDTAAALEHAEMSCKSGPTCGYLATWARALVCCGSTEKAIEKLREAIRIAPHDVAPVLRSELEALRVKD
jgi:tetratricopeptide (TPR) repeat protein